MSISRFASYNLLGQAVPILVSLVTMPLFVEAVGLERYGILSICWLMLGYFGVLDLGLSKAAAQRIAALRDAPDKARAEVFWTVFWINAAIGIVALALVTPLIRYGFGLQEMQPAVRSELADAYVWLAATVGLSLIVAPWGAVLTARERFGLVNVVEGTANIALSVVPLAIALLFGPRLEWLIAGTLAVRACASLVYLSSAVGAVPLGRPSMPRRDIARSLAVYGGWVTVSGIIGPILWQWDRFAIGAVLGASSVALYVIPFQFVWRLSIIPMSLAGALFPRMSSSTPESALALQDEASKSLLSILTPMIVVLSLVIEPFLRIWLGSDLGERTTDVAHFLIPGLWVNGLAQVGAALLLAQNRPGTLARLHLAELVPYVGALYIFMRIGGLEGAACAWTLRVLVDATVIFRLSTGSFTVLRTVVAPGALVVTMAGVSAFLPLESPWRWVLGVALLAATAVWSVKASPQVLRMRAASLAELVIKRVSFSSR